MEIRGARVLLLEDDALISIDAQDMLLALGAETVFACYTLAEAEAAVDGVRERIQTVLERVRSPYWRYVRPALQAMAALRHGRVVPARWECGKGRVVPAGRSDELSRRRRQGMAALPEGRGGWTLTAATRVALWPRTCLRRP